MKIAIRRARRQPRVPDGRLRGILVKDHKVCVDVKTALDTTIAGVCAHLSAMKGGEVLKVPSVV